MPTNRKWLRSPSERLGTLAVADLPPPEQFLDTEEHLLVRALRDGDEAAFERLLDLYYGPMLRLARRYVESQEEAEEVVQDTWLAVLKGLHNFRERSSLKTWIFRILLNRARSRGMREARQLPFSWLRAPSDASRSEWDEMIPEWLARQAVAAPLHWHGEALRPQDPAEEILSRELQDVMATAITALPVRQQQVIKLRDLEGWKADEVCTELELSEANQRVLLHRARLKVRDALEEYLAPPPVGEPMSNVAV